MQSYPLTRFDCGHVGRTNEAPRKVTAFIRVAEIRTSRVNESEKKCPDCGGKR